MQYQGNEKERAVWSVFLVDRDAPESLTQFRSPGHLLTASLLCVAGRGRGHREPVQHVWNSETSMRELVLFFYPVGPEMEFQS